MKWGGVLQCFLIVLLLMLRAVCWYFFDDTALYLFVTGITGCALAALWFYFVVEKVEPVIPGILDSALHFFDGISFEFYLIHAVLISGATSAFGFLDKGVLEIVALILISTALSLLLHILTDRYRGMAH